MNSIRNNSKSIHEKYLKRAQEIEEQEKKLKKELQHRIDESELPQISQKKIGVQRVLYDPRYDDNYQKLKQAYGSETESKRTPALIIAPRIVSHNSKEGISSRGNLIGNPMTPASTKGIIPPYDYKITPYK
uniref:Uncharacterized protein n=1 Tax=Euplotes harpa TaxID=151035 RepID=A0A7S3IZP4_9SPIT|mmetsp:Transcript_11664/g.13239  ORF Transcript_11664/g.13239 Transcript_11664/m.13239 type:complete len:131 (+) Transcript_11664:58-450(+)